jgi:hypothetical protein
MQNEAQIPPPKPQYWKPGQSGNPRGTTTRMKRHAELCAEFTRRRGRAPDAVENISLRNAGALSARIEARGNSDEDLVRLTNALTRLLAKLGLNAEPPAPERSKPAVLTASETLARMGMGGGTHER